MAIDCFLSEAFQAQVRKNPNHPAVKFQGKSLTYQTLHEKSNQFAHYLNRLGVNVGTKVALCIERSIESTIAILGIIKAGGVYVPIDHRCPREKIRFILEDTQSTILFLSSSMKEVLSKSDNPFRTQLIDITDSLSNAERESKNREASSEEKESLAYIMYTSGSTGNPKGVMIQQKSILHLAHRPCYLTIEPSDQMAHLSSLAFDGSTFEIWGALLNGATLSIASDQTLLNPTLLKEFLKTQCSVGFLTTALFNQIVRDCSEINK